MPLLGTETEYGITAPGRPDLDAHALSAAVVEACPVPATPVVEDSRHRMLGNGGRFYVDHGHPEYCTPETTSAFDALVWELAGDRIVAEASARASEVVGAPIKVFKNNTDGKGQSYGYHENVLLRRSTPWEAIEAALPAVLVTRPVLAGAGRVGLGPTSGTAGFQLSQRADFFERLAGLDTTQRRGIVNTRDEPHAVPRLWRRLHVIAGDATRSPWTTWLRLGTLSLVLATLEAGLLPTIVLADPVAAFRLVSRDTSCRAPLALAGGGADTAVGVQERLRDACAGFVERDGFPEGEGLVRAWTEALDALRTDPMLLADRVDWVAKLALLQAYLDREGLGWDHPKLAQVDLAWAELGSGGIVEKLARAGRLVEGPDAGAVASAMSNPPDDTRAHTRGTWVRDHVDHVVAAGWDSLLVRDTHGALHSLRMADPFVHGAVPDEDRPSGVESETVDALIRGHDAPPRTTP